MKVTQTKKKKPKKKRKLKVRELAGSKDRASSEKRLQAISKEVIAGFKPNPLLQSVLTAVGTDLLPLNDPSNADCWFKGKEQGSIPSDLYGFLEAIEESTFEEGKKFQAGYCFRNAETVNLANGQVFGANVQTYVGWLIFFGKDTFEPIHHCWNVYRHQKTSPALIDVSFDPKLIEIGEESESREETAKLMYERLNSDVPLCERTVIKDIPEGLLYIGCPCDTDEGRLIYQWWHKEVAQRFNLRNSAPGTMSETQRLIYQKEQEENAERRKKLQEESDDQVPAGAVTPDSGSEEQSPPKESS